MDKKNIVYQNQKIHSVFEWIWRILQISFLVVIFSLMGLVVFGLGPALFSANKIIRDWIRKDNPKVFSCFFENYKKDFWRGNLFFITYLVFFGLVAVNGIFFYQFMEPSFFRTTGLLITSVFGLFFLISFLFYPLLYEYLSDWKKAFKYSLTILWGFPLYLLLVIITLGASIVLVYLIPQLFSFFVIGGNLILVVFFGIRILEKIKIIEEMGEDDVS